MVSPFEVRSETLKQNMDGHTPEVHITWLMVQVVPSEPTPFVSHSPKWYVSSTLATLDSTSPVEAVDVLMVSPLVCCAHPLNCPCGG